MTNSSKEERREKKKRKKGKKFVSIALDIEIEIV